MPVYVTAFHPTPTISEGLVPAAQRLGSGVVVLTNQPEAHRAACRGHAVRPLAVEAAEVRDGEAVASRAIQLARRYGRPQALLSNSDLLQPPTALAAALLGLPGKDWRATVCCKSKALTRWGLAESGLDTVISVKLGPDDDVSAVAAHLPFPAVVKPQEGVASKDVWRVESMEELADRVARIRARRRGVTLVAEEYLPGPVHTFETLGDGQSLYHFSSWRCTLGAPPWSTTVGRRDWAPCLPEPVEQHLRAQLTALGVGLGACHTEFVIDGDRARIIEVNYRLLGDTMDFLCSDLLGIDLFTEVIRLHSGQRLRTDLPCVRRLRRHARLALVVADRSGTLAQSPAPLDSQLPGGILLTHRRLREPGTTAPLHHDSRDFLSTIRATGPGLPGGLSCPAVRKGHRRRYRRGRRRGWPAFLRSLIARRLSGVQLVVSDAHTRPVDAIG
ncbi:siderophore biosynthesis protein [Streptomyces sp. NPDC053474]|uniref:siderophore biosynthesis protein n=1 Tax=Streptomyces sp. NPDC053474 TaxID=3365704 RepID=UPI0037D1BB92